MLRRLKEWWLSRKIKSLPEIDEERESEVYLRNLYHQHLDEIAQWNQKLAEETGKVWCDGRLVTPEEAKQIKYEEANKREYQARLSQNTYNRLFGPGLHALMQQTGSERTAIGLRNAQLEEQQRNLAHDPLSLLGGLLGGNKPLQ